MITQTSTEQNPTLLTRSRTIRYTGIDRHVERWYAVHTPFRHEKLAQRDLERQGIKVWLPLLKETRRYERKYREVEIPLFSSYLFVCINERGYYPVIQSPYISGFIRFGEDILPVPEQEMDLIRLIVGEAEAIKAKPRELVIGDRVEIIGGKLTGVRGVLEGQRNSNQVSVSLQTLAYTLVVEVDPKFLRRI
jgi:transcription antitermination factor NusG